MNKRDYIDRAIMNSEYCLLTELREDYDNLSFIWGILHGNLHLPEDLREMTAEQQELLVSVTLEVIYDLLENKGCKVFEIKSTKHGSCATIEGFVEWHLPIEEAIAKIKAMWLKHGNSADPLEQPWFKIEDKEAPKDKELKN